MTNENFKLERYVIFAFDFKFQVIFAKKTLKNKYTDCQFLREH